MSVLTAIRDSVNKRVSTSFVHDVDLFVTVRLLDETPAVLLLHQLFSKHGYSDEWKIGETPRLAINWEINYLYNGQLRTSCHTRTVIIFQQQFVFNIEINGSVQLFTKKKREHYQIQSRLEVTSMHAGNRCWQILISRPRATMDQHIFCWRYEQGGCNARHSCLVTALHS